MGMGVVPAPSSPGPEGPERLFSDFFVTLGLKGPKGSVARPRILNDRRGFGLMADFLRC